MRLSGGGARVRIRFTNEYGTAPVEIGAAHVGLDAGGGKVRPGTDHVLTFGGRPTAMIPPGAPLVSDPVDLNAAPLSSLSISLYLPGEVSSCTCHGTAMQTGYVAAGDQTAAAAIGDPKPLPVRAMISAVDVAVPGAARTIVAFGDSCTDGGCSTPV